MREIKFRAWVGKMEYDITTGKFGTFFVNSGKNGDGLDERDSAILTPFNTKYPDDTPVMQYTGLHDKNGKEIYEGDVVRVYDSNRCGYGDFEDDEHSAMEQDYICTQEIKWNPDGGYFCSVDTGDFCPPIGSEDLYLEIIGNIYENPELLT